MSNLSAFQSNSRAALTNGTMFIAGTSVRKANSQATLTDSTMFVVGISAYADTLHGASLKACLASRTLY